MTVRDSLEADTARTAAGRGDASVAQQWAGHLHERFGASDDRSSVPLAVVAVRTISSAVAGLGSSAVLPIAATYPRQGDAPDDVVVGGATTAYSSALIVGTAARSGGASVQAAACLGAAIAVGSERNASPARILRAFALGIASAVALNRILATSPVVEPWNAAVPGAVLGSAVTAGLLAGCDAGVLPTVIGSAASQLLGHGVGQSEDLGALQCGKAAAHGVLAVTFTEAGFSAPLTSIEGRQGIFSAFGLNASPVKMGEEFLRGFLEEVTLVEPGVGDVPASVFGAHSSLADDFARRWPIAVACESFALVQQRGRAS